MSVIVDPNQPEGATPPNVQDHPNLIKDSGIAGFMIDVIEESKRQPVLVDFWAPWCEPCKTLMPMLEKQVLQAGGLIKLVKINFDDNQQIAAQLGIKSIPAVFLFKHGQPVDSFQGAIPESRLRAFIQKALGDAKSPIDQALDQAKQALDAGDFQVAGATYQQILEHDQTNPAAIGGFIRALIGLKEYEKCHQIATQLPKEITSQKEVASAISALELAEQGDISTTENAALEQALQENPKDHQARFDYAVTLYGQNNAEAAIDQLLTIIEQDRGWNDDAARKQLLKIFEALGHSDPVTMEGRSRLSTILFS